MAAAVRVSSWQGRNGQSSGSSDSVGLLAYILWAMKQKERVVEQEMGPHCNGKTHHCDPHLLNLWTYSLHLGPSR